MWSLWTEISVQHIEPSKKSVPSCKFHRRDPLVPAKSFINMEIITAIQSDHIVD